MSRSRGRSGLGDPLFIRSPFVLLTVFLIFSLVLGAGNAAAQNRENRESRAQQTAEPAAGREARQPLRVRVLPSPSQETAAQRERRLRAECKGRPNAGACLGYAS